MQIIINADDFGRSTCINTAIIRAHREGVLTSTSLMVAGDSVEEAVALARETPTLTVGLHVVIAVGKAVLPPDRIPHLVDHQGRFPDDAFITGLRYILSQKVQRELALELEAQFERFASTGLPLSHVDGHIHMHIHPTVFKLLLPLAERYGARGFRLPRDDLWLALGYNRQRVGIKLIWAITFGLLCRNYPPRLKKHNLTFTHRMYGLMQTGQMQEAYVVKVLRQMKSPTAELYFHPSTQPGDEPMGPNPSDLATLLSPAVREVIQDRDLHLATYPTLVEAKK